MLDDHSKLAPLLPIPNRTVKRLRADDSADSRVKVGHRQALTALNQPGQLLLTEGSAGLFLWDQRFLHKLCIADYSLYLALLRECMQRGILLEFEQYVEFV